MRKPAESSSGRRPRSRRRAGTWRWVGVVGTGGGIGGPRSRGPVTTTRCGVVAVSGAVSRPSGNNRHGGAEGTEPSDTDFRPSDLPEDSPALRPISVEPGTSLRNEAVMVDDGEGSPTPVYRLPESEWPEGEYRGRPTYRVLNEWRDWMAGYESAHIEYDSPSGETVRRKLQNSYQQEYANRYYARIKDFERGVRRSYGEGLTTAMLTFTASSENESGGHRCPADHMMEIREGWRTCRKALHKALDGRKWEYVRIWEPHKSGYGHLHVGVFVHDDGLEPETFKPVFRSYVENVDGAGSEAHRIEGDDAAISINDDVENLGSYLSEYIGQYGEKLQKRSIEEQIFYATTWATNTRRVDFSNGAQEIIEYEKFRRDTGLNPEGRGGREAYERWRASAGGGSGGDSEGADGDADGGEDGAGGGSGWGVSNLTYVRNRRRQQIDPSAGGVKMTRIDGRPGMDRPAWKE